MKRINRTSALWSATLLLAATAQAAVTPAQKCGATKLLAAGKKAAAKLKCQKAFILTGDATKQAACVGKAEQAFATAFQKAEARGGCATTGDATSIEASVDTCVSTLANALPCPSGGSLCGDVCANLLTDPMNCGTCGTTCSTAQCGPNVSSVACGGGTCNVASCTAGTYDADGACSNGCECGDMPGATSCAAAQTLGALASGQSLDATSNLPATGEEKYYTVTFAAGGSPSIRLSAGSPEFQFSVMQNCAGTLVSCIAFNLCTPPAGTYFVRVYRPAGAPTCNSYTLRLGN